MKFKAGKFLITTALLSVSLKGQALSPAFPPPAPGSLFSSAEPLQVKLQAPMSTLFDAKKKPYLEQKKFSVSGHLIYQDPKLQKVDLPVEIHLKGFSTLSMCPFPKLELKIKSAATKGSLFDGTKTVDLNSHCAEESEVDSNAPYASILKASFYNHREALAYRWMEALEIPGYRARPVWIQYQDTDSPSKVSYHPETTYRAFFVEDKGNFKKRVSVEEVRDVKDPMRPLASADEQAQFKFNSVEESPNMDREDVARIELFQFLIGNNDWFIRVNPSDSRGPQTPEGLWNEKVFETKKGQWIPVPQDFSLTALVFAQPYAMFVNKQFSKLSPDIQNKLKQSFEKKKDQLYSLTSELQQDSVGEQGARALLDNFFKNLPTLQ